MEFANSSEPTPKPRPECFTGAAARASAHWLVRYRCSRGDSSHMAPRVAVSAQQHSRTLKSPAALVHEAAVSGASHRNTTAVDGTAALIIIDAWPGTGIGHSILGTARWLNFATTTNTNIKFAFCLPASVTNRAASRASHTRSRRSWPNCSSPTTFDLYRYITWKGRSIRASSSVLNGVRAVLEHATCEDIQDAARSVRFERMSLALFYPHIKELRRCIGKGGVGSRSRTLNDQRLHELEFNGTLPACDVGLHLRTMKLDDASCNAMDATHNALNGSAECAGRLLRKKAKACDIPKLNLNTEKCHGARFATSDSDAMYKQLTSWANLGETAIATWSNGDKLTDARERQRRYRETVRAWFTLASCKQIIAPVESAFWRSAARHSHSPHSECC